MATHISDKITSYSNPLIKQMRSLSTRKGRAESGLFLAEGTRLVTQGLDQDWLCTCLLVNSESLDRSYIADLVAKAAKRNCKIVQVPERLLGKVSRKDNPQEVVAAFEQRAINLDRFQPLTKGIWLGLYEIRDPGNLGTILRTADCAKISGVMLLENCCDPYSVEAVRASMGSIFDVPFAHVTFEEFNTWRKASGIFMIAASVNGTTRFDSEIYPDKSVILMGNEQSGLPPEIETLCDTLAIIPMRGGADSLNLAQATAIMTYEAWRQRNFQ